MKFLISYWKQTNIFFQTDRVFFYENLQRTQFFLASALKQTWTRKNMQFGFLFVETLIVLNYNNNHNIGAERIIRKTKNNRNKSAFNVGSNRITICWYVSHIAYPIRIYRIENVNWIGWTCYPWMHNKKWQMSAIYFLKRHPILHAN